MLNKDDIRRLTTIASSTRYDDVSSIKPMAEKNYFSELFVGRDAENYPYGMLTSLGAQQLVSLGQKLRTRYQDIEAFRPLFTSLNKQPFIYCRSTSICRTIISLHSILYGLLKGSLEDYTLDSINFHTLPVINTRPKMRETLYPQADGPCPAICVRRDNIFRNDYLYRCFPRYLEFETKMKTLLGK